MSNEVSMQVRFSVKKGTFSKVIDSGVLLQDHYSEAPEVACGTKIVLDSSYQSISDQPIYNPGFLYIKNLGPRALDGVGDPQDYSSPCLIGTYNSSVWAPFAKVLPSEACLLRLDDSSDYRIRSVDGECFIEFSFFEDNRLNIADTLNPDEDDYT